MTTAKLFWSGNSQALRLPKAFRFHGDKVSIKRKGNQVILEPIITDWSWLDQLGEFDTSLESAVLENRNALLEPERDWDF
ncbi:antitoxin [Testudinibacter aquarius]|uniref:AbrB/MazE/SpoVT family DNA-binding domain-containing protein n=1 Tax=Testudinibacter aquarius TaxID=1524974 RepID=A0A4R3Y1H5_9PAST|nr:AbrB/MazE/SpoVT family DNA-binding domain-containing protein [Testudinibacter aquarius]TNG94771.1 AbrB/MazE/SpoVT family DNA-binding domain-containing protein [Pasteurellaceae bacterium UScroc12]TNG94971.1 AbrB/MazE/SpoVT family DNA-binding domain-containing protein [Pasteurellaceae bacterium USgator41]TNH00654.1 AbrB/MazE/SpoVT family DNA-binding domain-containing protein [Pasteurellaceae bacterium UScroc31]TNH02100.1 AbrB/MazE/SpoVT family DNA-binding domain-containing protein [Pasteurella